MKRFLLLITFTFFTLLLLQAQTIQHRPGEYSASFIDYMASYDKTQDKLFNSRYVHSFIDQRSYLNAFIKVKDDIDQKLLESIGVVIGTKAGNVWTIKIPSDKVREFSSAVSGLCQVQLDSPVHINLDVARAKTKVDMVHEGVWLPQAFTGKDVVVGVLDVGFDYTHPTFYNSDGTEYRVKRVWEQKRDGNAPEGYAYGHEMIETEEILNQKTDSEVETHGTHVAGIAAGSGYGGKDNEHIGVAYESDIVFVGITPPQEQWKNTGMTDIVDGLNYIFEYAESEGKAAVANLSWGCSIGPHDGTSLFSQAVDNLTGEGKIFTISAGNNGSDNVHLSKTFTEEDTLIQSFARSSNLPGRPNWIDIWGEPGETFCVELKTNDGFNTISSTGFLCLDNSKLDTFLLGSDNDTLFISLTTLEADINGKPHAFLDLLSNTFDITSIAVKGMSGSIDIWMGYVFDTRGYYGQFNSLGRPDYTDGDTNMTIGEMACTKSAITVGAYASKIDFTNVSGEATSYASYVTRNAICPFSSIGPTTDDRIKPDIAAPGMTLASAVSSYDQRYTPGGSSFNNVVHKFTDSSGRDYYYGEAFGTSMSSPMAAGIVALVLEADPTLTPEEMIQLLKETAIKDIYTTDSPDPDVWGYGKINAHEMLRSFFTSSLEEEDDNHIMYPNPVNEFLFFSTEGEKSINISDLLGQKLYDLTTNENHISLKELPIGVYMVSLYNSDGSLITKQKIVKN